MARVQEYLDKKLFYKVFLQIGTNNGNDRFREMVLRYKPERVILIEPNKELIHEIESNYKDIGGVVIENVAITTEEKEVTLYLPWADDKGRSRDGYYYGHSKFSLIPMNNWGRKENMRKITAKGVTMNSILKKHHIRGIDYLCLDTEGYDAEILKSFDLWKHPIDLLQYEKWDFDPTVFARHNDNWEQLGSAGMDVVQGMFSLMGYEIYDDEDDTNNKIAVTNRNHTWK